jgi:molybdenum cofactor cytidylyltransferase
VVLTTTTKLALPQTQLAAAHRVVRKPGDLDDLEHILEDHPSVIVTGPAASGEPKWLGLDLERLEALRLKTAETGAVLLIEADGARGRSLKAPGLHEPVVPPFVDLVVPVAGLDALGAPLDSARVHRPEQAGRLLGLRRGELIDARHVAALLAATKGGLKGVPPGAEVRALLNKADSPARLDGGREVASAALESPRLRAVVLAAVAEDQPVREVFGRVAGVVLAAGGSDRFGRPKQLVSWRGRPLVWYAVRAALAGGLKPVAVVVGAEAEQVREALEAEPVSFVHNPDWRAGQSSSVRAGLAAVEADAEAAVFLLADTPLVSDDLVKALVAEHRRTMAPLVAPRVGKRRANPALFDRATFPGLHGLEGDKGGRELFRRYDAAWVEWDDSILLDIDTPGDLRRLEGMA